MNSSKMPMNQRPIAVITGATGGIGGHLASLCAAQGMHVVAVGRDRTSLQALAVRLGSEAVTQCALDLLGDGAAEAVLHACSRVDAPLRLLVNCAGKGQLAAFRDASFSSQREIWRLNFEVATELTHVLLPSLESGRGQVLNVASLVGLLPTPNLAALSASKAALLNWSLALRQELKGRVGITTFCPGITRTCFLKTAGMSHLRLEEHFFAEEAERVARWALDAVLAGKALAYCGHQGRIAALAMRLLPSGFLSVLAGMLLKPEYPVPTRVSR